MTPLTFEQWRAQELATRSPDFMVDCQECCGGEVACDECGHPHECETCNGSGLQRFGDLPMHKQEKTLDIHKYEKQLIEDYAAVERFTVKQPGELLLEAELQPYVHVRFLPHGDGSTRINRGSMGIGALERLRC